MGGNPFGVAAIEFLPAEGSSGRSVLRRFGVALEKARGRAVLGVEQGSTRSLL